MQNIVSFVRGGLWKWPLFELILVHICTIKWGWQKGHLMANLYFYGSIICWTLLSAINKIASKTILFTDQCEVECILFWDNWYCNKKQQISEKTPRHGRNRRPTLSFNEIKELITSLEQGWPPCGPQKNFVRPANFRRDQQSWTSTFHSMTKTLCGPITQR